MNATIFHVWCEMSGFDLAGFERWLERLPPCGAKQELTERRALAEAALMTPPSNQDAALRHIEWMMQRQREIRREDALLPLAKSRKKQIDALPRPSTAERAKKEEYWRSLQAWVEEQHSDFPCLSYEQIKQKAVQEKRATLATMKRHTTRWK